MDTHFYSFIEKIEETKKRRAGSYGFGSGTEREILKERLKAYVREMENIEENEPVPSKSYLDLTDPMGADGRTIEEEIFLYKKAKASGNRYEMRLSYCRPDFESDENIARWKIKLERYAELRGIFLKEENTAIRGIVLYMLEIFEVRVKHLLALSEYCAGEKRIHNAQGHALSSMLARKKAIEDDCFRYVAVMYGSLDGEIVKRARADAEERKRGSSKHYSELEKILLANIFYAEEASERLNRFFAKAGLENCLAVVDGEKENCVTISGSREFDGKTVVKIPADYEVNGMELLRLISHEACHAMTDEFQSRDLGLGNIKFGRFADDISEGVAVLAEKEITNKAAGFEEIKHQAHPYYILAMEEMRRRSEDGKKKVNPGEIYDFILENIRHEFSNEGFSQEEIDDEAGKILRRVFRGVPGCRHYNTKDSMYFKGEEFARILKDTGNLRYVEECCVDPELIPVFLEIGIYDLPSDKERRLANCTGALKNILEDEEWSREYLLERLKNDKLQD